LSDNLKSLIEEINSSEDYLRETISNGGGDRIEDIDVADGQLEAAFSYLLSYELTNVQDLLTRIDYLSHRLVKDSDARGMDHAIRKTILRDSLALAKSQGLAFHDNVYQLNIKALDKPSGLIEFSYMSKAKRPYSFDELAAHTEKFRANNLAKNITGLLSYDPDTLSFMQILEGEKGAVNQLVDTIKSDNRHSHMTQKFMNKINKRCYSSWSMMYIQHDNGAFLHQ